jgi:hypothetical protein
MELHLKPRCPQARPDRDTACPPLFLWNWVECLILPKSDAEGLTSPQSCLEYFDILESGLTGFPVEREIEMLPFGYIASRLAI